MLTQTELAEALNVTYASVNRWENSKNVPNRAMAIAILNYAREHGASIDVPGDVEGHTFFLP